VNNPNSDLKSSWLADAMAANFSTMPLPFMWEESSAFAHLIDGYGIAGGVSECAKIANSAIDSEPRPDDRVGSAMQLWVALFGEHRSHRHSGYPPSPEAVLYLDSLCEALRGRLQNLDPDDRERLLAIMAAHPGWEVRRGSNLR
jgi:hypothetical protein